VSFLKASAAKKDVRISLISVNLMLMH